MPRTTLTVITPKGPHPGTITANLLDTPFAAADQANGNQFPHTGSELLVMRNAHATNAGTVTVKSAADVYGRTGDVTTYSLEAGDTAALLMTDTNGWRQTDGNVWLDIAGTGTINFLVLKIR
jgi:hypothetical protein